MLIVKPNERASELQDSDRNDVNEFRQAVEVFRVAGVQVGLVDTSSRRDQQVKGARRGSRPFSATLAAR